MKIFIIRHGESTSDVENRYGGDYDDHLTEKGVEQAAEMSDKLIKTGIEFVFSSSKLRARETANILKNVLNCNIEIVDDLRERNRYGILTGMEKTEALNKYPKLVSQVVDGHNTIDGAENYEEFTGRIKGAFEEVLKKSNNFNFIAIISHGGPIKCIIEDVLKLGKLGVLADCAIIELEKNNTDFRVLNLDGVSLE